MPNKITLRILGPIDQTHLLRRALKTFGIIGEDLGQGDAQWQPPPGVTIKAMQPYESVHLAYELRFNKNYSTFECTATVEEFKKSWTWYYRKCRQKDLPMDEVRIIVDPQDAMTQEGIQLSNFLTTKEYIQKHKR